MVSGRNSFPKIKEGMTVVVNLHSPPERLWGLLTDISAAGIQIRGISVSTFEEWVSSILGQDRNVDLTSAFFPMWRVERMSLDETMGEILSLGEEFRARIGVTLQEYLGHSPRQRKDTRS